MHHLSVSLLLSGQRTICFNWFKRPCFTKVLSLCSSKPELNKHNAEQLFFWMFLEAFKAGSPWGEAVKVCCLCMCGFSGFRFPAHPGSHPSKSSKNSHAQRIKSSFLRHTGISTLREDTVDTETRFRMMSCSDSINSRI